MNTMDSRTSPERSHTEDVRSKSLSRKRSFSDVSSSSNDASGEARHRDSALINVVTPKKATDNDPEGLSTLQYSDSKRVKPTIASDNSAATPRSSKFKEGSMHDRVSKEPPSIFLKDELAIDNYMAEQQLKAGALQKEHHLLHRHHHQYQHNARAGSSVSSHKTFASTSSGKSGIYRFGKAIASAFNFSSKKLLPKDDSAKHFKDDRQTRAEKAYAELKNAGYFSEHAVRSETKLHKKGYDDDFNDRSNDETIFSVADHDYDTRWTQTNSLRNHKLDEDEDEPEPRPHRDSGVSVGDGRVSDCQTEEDARRSIDNLNVYEGVNRSRSRLVKPEPLSTPSSRTSYGGKKSFRFQSPSFSSHKKTKSHLMLPNNKWQNDSQEWSSTSVSGQEDGPSQSKTVLKSLSSKNLKRQAKLSKKVSNLEAKLEAARRELEAITSDEESVPPVPPVPPLPPLQDIPPTHVRRRLFKPGALPTLLSESLLSEHLQGNDNEDDDDGNARELKSRVELEQVVNYNSNSTEDVSGEKAFPKGMSVIDAIALDSNYRSISAPPVPLRAPPEPPKAMSPKKRKSSNELTDAFFNPQSQATHDNDDVEWKSTRRLRQISDDNVNNKPPSPRKAVSDIGLAVSASTKCFQDGNETVQQQDQTVGVVNRSRKASKKENDSSPGTSVWRTSTTSVSPKTRVTRRVSAHRPSHHSSSTFYPPRSPDLLIRISPTKDGYVPPVPNVPDELKRSVSPIKRSPTTKRKEVKKTDDANDEEFEWPDYVL